MDLRLFYEEKIILQSNKFILLRIEFIFESKFSYIYGYFNGYKYLLNLISLLYFTIFYFTIFQQLSNLKVTDECIVNELT